MADTIDDPSKEKTEKTGGMSVAGQQTPQAQNQPSQPSQGGQSGPAPSQAQQAPQAAQEAPRSGMTSSLKSYLKANQPQAGKMASAATQKVGQQAAQIGQQAQQKRAALQNQLQANQQKVQQQVGQAQQTLQGVIGGEAAQAPTAEQAQQFQQLSRGEFQGIQATPTDINLAQQQNRASAIQNLARQSETEAGRSELLRQTFGQGPQQYTRGQSALDSALIGTSAPAQQQITQNIQQQAQQAQQVIQDAQTGARADVGATQELIQNSPAELQAAYETAMGAEGLTDLGDQVKNLRGIDEQMSGLREGGDAVVDQYLKNTETNLAAQKKRVAGLERDLAANDSGFGRSIIQQNLDIERQKLNQAQSAFDTSQNSMGDYIAGLQGDSNKKVDLYKNYQSQIEDLIKSPGGKSRDIAALVKEMQQHGISKRFGTSVFDLIDAKRNISKQLPDILREQKSITGDLNKYKDFITRGKLTDQLETSLEPTRTNLDKYSALKQLMGGQSEYNIDDLYKKYSESKKDEKLIDPIETPSGRTI